MNEKTEMKLFLKGKGKLILMIAGFVTGAILLLWGSGMSDGDTPAETEKSRDDGMYYSEKVEKRIEAFLETVSGIDSAQVFVTVDGGNEYEYARKGDAEGYAADYLIIDSGDGEEAAIVREVYPQIRGIAVTCTGGNSPSVQEQITSLLSAALGIPANKIEVAGQS